FIVDFHAAKGPHERIGKKGRVAKRMPQALANGHTVFFEFFAGGEVLFPGIRQFVNPGLLEDILAVRMGTTTKEVRHAAGDTVNPDRVHNERIKLVTAELSNELIVVFQATSVELRVVIVELQDIGTLAAFDGRCGTGWQVVGIDVLDGDLYPCLLAEFS